jgi:hypothetical protein
VRRLDRLFAIVLGCGLALAALPARADEFRGRIVSVDPAAAVFVVKNDDATRHFRVAKDTVTRKDGQNREFGDVSPGDLVRVESDGSAGRDEIATAEIVDVLEGSASTDPGPEGVGTGGLGELPGQVKKGQ